MIEKKHQNQGLDNIDFYVSPKTKKGGNSRVHPSGNTRDLSGEIGSEMVEFNSKS